MSLVYKYCSTKTFRKIISDRQIIMNDITKSNDKKELNLLKDLLIKCLNDFCKKNYEKVEEFKMYTYHMIEEFYDEEIQSYKYFVTCFSSLRDSELMWETYGDKCEGMCIGFNKELLISCNNHYPNCIFAEVNYINEEEINSVLNELIKNTYYRFQKNCPHSYEKEPFIVSINELALEIFTKSVFYKKEWWKEEKEFRFTNWDTIEIIKAGQLPIKGVDINTRSFNNGLEITELQYENDINNFYKYLNFVKRPDFIKEIIIGPKNSISFKYLQGLLINYGFETSQIEIKKSEGMVQYVY